MLHGQRRGVRAATQHGVVCGACLGSADHSDAGLEHGVSVADGLQRAGWASACRLDTVVAKSFRTPPLVRDA